MKPSRIVIAWMVLWLAASGALAAAMPYCQHAPQPASASTPDRVGHETPSGSAHDHAGHGSPAPSHGAHATLACDDCGTCHLIGSGMPAAPMTVSPGELAGLSRPFMAVDFRGRIPDRPYHPPRSPLAA